MSDLFESQPKCSGLAFDVESQETVCYPTALLLCDQDYPELFRGRTNASKRFAHPEDFDLTEEVIVIYSFTGRAYFQGCSFELQLLLKKKVPIFRQHLFLTPAAASI